MTLDDATERALLADLEAGGVRRSTATARVLAELTPLVHGLCLRLLGNVDDARDCTHDVLLSLQQALPGFRGDARLTTWAFRAAVRAALRVRARRAEGGGAGVEPSLDGVTQAEQRDELRRVLAAMQKLSFEHRVVLSLFALEGLSHQTIAETLGVPVGTVWSRLAAARAALVRQL